MIALILGVQLYDCMRHVFVNLEKMSMPTPPIFQQMCLKMAKDDLKMPYFGSILSSNKVLRHLTILLVLQEMLLPFAKQILH